MNAELPIRPGPARGQVRESRPHDSAIKQVTGRAFYTDDIVEPAGTLEAYVAQSTEAHARITRLDVAAVRTAPGVRAVLTAADVPGVNNVGPVLADDPIFAEGLVEYVGQSLFAVIADDVRAARAAARLAVVEYEPLPALITVEAALAAGSYVLPSVTMRRGDAATAIAGAPHRLAGRLEIGGQDHFYLEGQISLALPGEDGDVTVVCSTQHPSEVQHLVAHALHVPVAAVTVEVRRMGGGFGGKETQASLFAAIAAIGARVTGRPIKLRLDRDDDMVMTGKRHDFLATWDVGFDGEGRLHGLKAMLAARCGYSADLSAAICDRALFHLDNAYYIPAVEAVSHRCKTHTVSNTAFRGFGGPQGMMVIERILDDVARHLRLDPLEVRRRNLYGDAGRDVTPYGMTVEDNVMPQLIAELVESSGYQARREAVAAFNAANPILKKGLALTPVKFGISFTTTHLNQAGALIHLYQDGSVHLNHGGTEMGQGLFTKVAQVVATEFGIDVDHVKITATTTAKVPNTSATAASSGSDMNGKAAQAAAQTLKARLAEVAAAEFGCRPEDVAFADNRVSGGDRSLGFAEVVTKAYFARVSLSSTGYYRTPKIHFDKDSFTGRPFYYFAYGAAVAEVTIDTLTGEYRLDRADILHDCGASLNPAIDRGQVEGGFIQGMGWLTSEELVFDGRGRLRTHAPSTYKIPACGDVPAEFHVTLLRDNPNTEPTIHRSKAVGEPPLMLGISVFAALRDAVAATYDDPAALPALDAPATPERVLAAIAP
ncbi:MAG: xanthine dehydrogenase molybdopterin binding subunit [Alphaproteobacteria bacterium]|jgi:xanthine dehydrogenase large subunit|nr:xanthine dehydrogenase molybdopterin binding subunit [Alphaproteobacteria bacterium]